MKEWAAAAVVASWPFLACGVVVLVIELRHVRRQLTTSQAETDAAVKLRRHMEGELATVKRRNAYLEERNAQLIYNALSQNVRLIKVNKN